MCQVKERELTRYDVEQLSGRYFPPCPHLKTNSLKTTPIRNHEPVWAHISRTQQLRLNRGNPTMTLDSRPTIPRLTALLTRGIYRSDSQRHTWR